jgi:catalase
VLDATKIIPEEVIPVRLIGRMVLDRNPDNFFAETEQVAFCPANIVAGVAFTNDPAHQRSEMPDHEFSARRADANECS